MPRQTLVWRRREGRDWRWPEGAESGKKRQATEMRPVYAYPTTSCSKWLLIQRGRRLYVALGKTAVDRVSFFVWFTRTWSQGLRPFVVHTYPKFMGKVPPTLWWSLKCNFSENCLPILGLNFRRLLSSWWASGCCVGGCEFDSGRTISQGLKITARAYG